MSTSKKPVSIAAAAAASASGAAAPGGAASGSADAARQPEPAMPVPPVSAEVVDIAFRETAEGPVQDESARAWMSACEAATRAGFDSLEQATNAWAQMVAGCWMAPMQWWWPGMVQPDTEDTSPGVFASRLMAGTTPPQPLQETTRELMLMGWRFWAECLSIATPWARPWLRAGGLN